MTGYAPLLFGLAAFCAVIALKPRATWRALAGWQFKDPDGAELTDEMYAVRSLSAGLGCVVLAGTGIWILLTAEENECRQILATLGDAAAGVDFDRAGLAEISDDFEARWDLDTAASRLEVDLVDQGSSVDVVAEDGDVLGTIDADGVVDRCG